MNIILLKITYFSFLILTRITEFLPHTVTGAIEMRICCANNSRILAI
ncbi:hypothetical protein LSO9J_120039 [Candidatus Liberibacter solanacearum]